METVGSSEGLITTTLRRAASRKAVLTFTDVITLNLTQFILWGTQIYSEDGSSIFNRNIGNYQTVRVTSQKTFLLTVVRTANVTGIPSVISWVRVF
jgi:hypothetical protein